MMMPALNVNWSFGRSLTGSPEEQDVPALIASSLVWPPCVAADVLMNLEPLWSLISSSLQNMPGAHCSLAWQQTAHFWAKCSATRLEGCEIIRQHFLQYVTVNLFSQQNKKRKPISAPWGHSFKSIAPTLTAYSPCANLTAFRLFTLQGCDVPKQSSGFQMP